MLHRQNNILVAIFFYEGGAAWASEAKLKILLALNKFYHCTKLEVYIFNSLADIGKFAKQYFGGHFEYEGSTAWGGGDFNQRVPSLICTYILTVTLL